jgi:hypothetical protein
MKSDKRSKVLMRDAIARPDPSRSADISAVCGIARAGK